MGGSMCTSPRRASSLEGARRGPTAWRRRCPARLQPWAPEGCLGRGQAQAAAAVRRHRRHHLRSSRRGLQRHRRRRPRQRSRQQQTTRSEGGELEGAPCGRCLGLASWHAAPRACSPSRQASTCAPSLADSRWPVLTARARPPPPRGTQVGLPDPGDSQLRALSGGGHFQPDRRPHQGAPRLHQADCG